MKRFAGYVLTLALLVGMTYVILTYAPKFPQLSTSNITETEKDGTEMQVEVINGETATYRIEVHYPQFGISSVDSKIKAVVDNAVAAFKEYPANPPESSVPQNELTGSFDSVYVGPDFVSVKLSLSEYTGGAHPNTVIIGVNVDRKTGKELTLDDALTLIGKSLEEVAEQSLKELKATLGDDIISPEGAAPEPKNYNVFLVSKEKVTFVFNSYQVAPYSAGQQQVSFKRAE